MIPQAVPSPRRSSATLAIISGTRRTADAGMPEAIDQHRNIAGELTIPELPEFPYVHGLTSRESLS
jgi:hypothetical protein